MHSVKQGSPLVLLALHGGEYSHKLMQAVTEGGVVVYATESGRTAIRFCRAHMPEVVVIDEKLTDMSGFDLCDSIRLDGVQFQQPAILLLSNNRDLQYRMRGFISGAQRCIFKTDDPVELLEAVEFYVEKIRAQRSQEPVWPRNRVKIHCVFV